MSGHCPWLPLILFKAGIPFCDCQKRPAREEWNGGRLMFSAWLPWLSSLYKHWLHNSKSSASHCSVCTCLTTGLMVKLLPPPKEGGYVFASVYLSVCLFVCLFVNSLSQKDLHGFSQNFYRVFLITKARASSILGDLAKKNCCHGKRFWYFSR